MNRWELSWAELSQTMLEKKHIRIPIEKRFFLNFVTDDETCILKKNINRELLKRGFQEDDPRLRLLRRNLQEIVTDTIDYEEFKDCIRAHICLFKKIFSGETIIPDFQGFCLKIRDIYEDTLSYKDGKNADYISQLEKVSPEKLSLIHI